MTRTIQKFFLCIPALALAVVFGSAQPVSAAPKWQGFYVGVHGGAGIMTAERDTNSFFYNDIFPTVNYAESSDDHFDAGLIFGGQVGYDHKLGNSVVLGIQASGNFGSLRSKTDEFSYQIYPSDVAVDYGEASVSISSRYSASLKLGTLVNPNTLVYLVGGWSWAKLKYDAFQYSASTFAGLENISINEGSDSTSGWHGGVGFETKLTDSLGLTMEYRYHNFKEVSSESIFGGGPYVGYSEMKVDPSVHTATIGLNYKF